MTDYTRYGVYYAPPAGSPLAAFGAAWLGWDAAAGQPVDHPSVEGVDLAAMTATPRKYGFHGTLKPPFRLADGRDPAALDAAISDLAARTAAFEAPPLALRRLGHFLALVPSEPSAPLADLASACVRDLDAFRSPASEADMAKRRAAGLSARQEQMLQAWGYPYVLDEFRFHLTLSGRVTDQSAEPALAALSQLTAPLTRDAMPVTELCLFGELSASHPHAGHFRIIRRYALTG